MCDVATSHAPVVHESGCRAGQKAPDARVCHELWQYLVGSSNKAAVGGTNTVGLRFQLHVGWFGATSVAAISALATCQCGIDALEPQRMT